MSALLNHWRKSSKSKSERGGLPTRGAARARARKDLDELLDELDGLKVRPGDLIWTYRREFAPFAVALGLLLVAEYTHDFLREPARVVVLLVGAMLTLALIRWKTSRLAEALYVGSVGAAGTLWTLGASYLGVAHGPILLVWLVLTLLAAVPWWFHRRPRGPIQVNLSWSWWRRLFRLGHDAPAAIKRHMAKVVEGWEPMVDALGLGSVRLQSSKADEFGWTMRLRLPGWLTVADVVAKIPKVEVAMRVRPSAVRVEADATRADLCSLRVNLTDPLAVATPYPGPSSETVAEPLEVGVFEDRSVVRLPLGSQHVLAAGVTGAGKSGFLNVVLAELAARRDVCLWGVDVAKVGVEFGPWRSVFHRLATSRQEAVSLLSAAEEVRKARARSMAAKGVREWLPTPETPFVVVVVDELSELAEDKTAMDLITTLCRLGRQQGVFTVLATQRPTADALGSLDARANTGIRVALRVDEPRDGDLILGQGRRAEGWQPDRLSARTPGAFLVRGGDHMAPRPARAYLVTDAQVRDLSNRLSSHRPALDELSAEAAHTAESIASGSESRVLELLAEAPAEGVKAADLVESLGMSRSGVHSLLKQLSQGGRVQSVRRGYWRATPEEVPIDA